MDTIGDWNLDLTIALWSHDSNTAVQFPAMKSSLYFDGKTRLVAMSLLCSKKKKNPTHRRQTLHTQCVFQVPHDDLGEVGNKHIHHVFKTLKINRIAYDQSLIQEETRKEKLSKLIGHPCRGDDTHNSQVMSWSLLVMTNNHLEESGWWAAWSGDSPARVGYLVHDCLLMHLSNVNAMEDYLNLSWVVVIERRFEHALYLDTFVFVESMKWHCD